MSVTEKYPHLAEARRRLQEIVALGKEKKAELEATYSDKLKEEKKPAPMSIETKASAACPPPPQKKARRSRSKKAQPAPPPPSPKKSGSGSSDDGSGSSRSSSSSSSGSERRRHKHSRGRSRGHSRRPKKTKPAGDSPPLPVVDNVVKTTVPTIDAPPPSSSSPQETKKKTEEADIDALVKKRVEEEMTKVHSEVKQTVRQAQAQISLSKILAI